MFKLVNIVYRMEKVRTIFIKNESRSHLYFFNDANPLKHSPPNQIYPPALFLPYFLAFIFC